MLRCPLSKRTMVIVRYCWRVPMSIGFRSRVGSSVHSRDAPVDHSLRSTNHRNGKTKSATCPLFACKFPLAGQPGQSCRCFHSLNPQESYCYQSSWAFSTNRWFDLILHDFVNVCPMVPNERIMERGTASSRYFARWRV